MKALRRGVHVPFQAADAPRLFLHRLKRIEKADTAAVDNNELLNGFRDFLDDMRGDEDDPRVPPEALRQHVVKFDAHDRIEAEDRLIQKNHPLVA